jgi:hypothetical protein
MVDLEDAWAELNLFFSFRQLLLAPSPRTSQRMKGLHATK